MSSNDKETASPLEQVDTDARRAAGLAVWAAEVDTKPCMDCGCDTQGITFYVDGTEDALRSAARRCTPCHRRAMQRGRREFETRPCSRCGDLADVMTRDLEGQPVESDDHTLCDECCIDLVREALQAELTPDEETEIVGFAVAWPSSTAASVEPSAISSDLRSTRQLERLKEEVEELRHDRELLCAEVLRLRALLPDGS